MKHKKELKEWNDKYDQEPTKINWQFTNETSKFDKLSISIQIEYRRAGSNESYTVIEKTWTNSTNDQLAETIRIELATAGNYEFRVLRTSQEDGSTRALEEIKWVGLKSVTSTIDRYDNMTVLICRFKGNETLSELSENQLATYWTRKLPALGYSDNQPLVATRDIAPVSVHCTKLQIPQYSGCRYTHGL